MCINETQNTMRQAAFRLSNAFIAPRAVSSSSELPLLLVMLSRQKLRAQLQKRPRLYSASSVAFGARRSAIVSPRAAFLLTTYYSLLSQLTDRMRSGWVALAGRLK